MATKLNFAQNLQSDVTQLAQLMDRLGDCQTAYFSRGYNSGGTAIADADVASLGITAANVTSAITMIQQLQKFMANQAVTTGAYQTTVDQVRNDV